MDFGAYPVANYRFLVCIGVLKMSFSKVTNLSRSLEYDTIAEGGRNSYVHTFTKPKQQQETIVLERGVAPSLLLNLINPFAFKVGQRLKLPVTIFVLGNEGPAIGSIQKAYGFNEGVVTKLDIGDLDASTGSVLIEKFEITHTGLLDL